MDSRCIEVITGLGGREDLLPLPEKIARGHETSLVDSFFLGSVSRTTKHGLQEFWIVILFKLRLVVFEMGRTKQRQPKAAGSFAFYPFQIPRIRVLLIPYDQCRSSLQKPSHYHGKFVGQKENKSKNSPPGKAKAYPMFTRVLASVRGHRPSLVDWLVH